MEAIENRLRGRFIPYAKGYLKLMVMLSGHGKPIEVHKTRLGPPTFHKVAGSQSRRFAIWAIGDLRVWVHNVKGVCLEVPDNCTSKLAWDLWRQYRDKMR